MTTIEQIKKEFEKKWIDFLLYGWCDTVEDRREFAKMEEFIEKALKESYNKGYEEGLNTKVVGSTKVKSKTTHDRGGGLADLI